MKHLVKRPMNATVLALVLSTVCIVAAAQTSVNDWQAKAAQKYPSLAVKGSPLNTSFIQAVAERRKTNPGFFTNPQWPLLLADELAGSLVPAAPSVPGDPATAGVKVAVGGVSYWSGSVNGKPVGGPHLKLALNGAELDEAKGARVSVKSATDGAGTPMMKKEDFENEDGKFKPLQKPFGDARKTDAHEFELELSFNAKDDVKSMSTLAGNIELVMPARDPASIIAASFAKDSGKPFSNPALKALGVEITLQKPSGAPTGSGTVNGIPYQEYNLTYKIKDPMNKVAAVEFFDARGKKLESSGTSSMSEGDADAKTVSASFQSKPPADAVVRIYLLTARSVISVPFDFKDIPLPGR